MNGVNPPSKSNYNIHSSGLSTGRVEEPLCKEGLEAYHEKLLLSAECYKSRGITCFPTQEKRPLPGFFYQELLNRNMTIEELKDLFVIHQKIITGLAILGAYVPQQEAYLNVIDIDCLPALEKIKKTGMADYLFTTKVKTFHGYHFCILTTYEVQGYKNIYFEGRKVGEYRGVGSYWIAPPSEFIMKDKEDPGKMNFYYYRFLDPIYPIIKIGEEETKWILDFFQVKGTRTRGTINRKEKESIPGISERPDSTTEKIYQVEFKRGITGNHERLFALLGYSGLCPFHEETNPSFGFYTAENGKKRAKDFHDGESYSMGELFLYYPKEPTPKGAIEEPEEREKLSKGLYTVFNKIVNCLSENIDNIEASINSEPFQKMINGKRKRNRWGYKKALLFILGLVLLRKKKSFILPIEIISKLIGVSRKQGLKFLKQLEAENFIKSRYKRVSKNSKYRVWVYKKGERLKTIL